MPVPFLLSFLFRLLLVCLPLAGLARAAGVSGSVTVAWNANTETNLSGYRVVYGTSASKLDQNMVVGAVTTAVLNGLETGITYYCAVQAFNTSSLYSDLSPTISFVVPEVLQPLFAVTQGSTGASLTSGGRIILPLGGGTESLVIRNAGTANLTGLRFSVDGVDASDFQPSSPSVTNLPPGESTTISVQFRPTDTGGRVAALHLSGDGLSSFDITLSGEGIPVPEIAVEQPSGYDLSAGSATVHFQSAVGGTGNTEVFTIRNTGSATLSGLALTVSGEASREFPFTPPAVNSLAPGASTTFQVTFQPTVEGIRSATLQIASNDADESPFNIVLEGNGPSLPEISVSLANSTQLTDGVSTVGFGNVTLGAIAETQNLTITNTGAANITGLAITTDGLHIGDFTVGNPGATFLPPGASTTVRVTFQPSAAGLRSGSIHIASNDADENPFDIALTGTGIAMPDIAVSRSNLTGLTGGSSIIPFVSTNLGASSATETLTINNTGTATLSGIAVSITGVHAGDFTLETPASSSLVPSAGTTFKVAFKPTAAGVRTATLQLVSNDPDENPFLVTLTGNGVAVPEIVVIRANGSDLVDGVATLGLGSINIGASSVTEVLTIRNTGTAALTGLAISTTGHTTDFTITSPAVTSLAPGASTTFSVLFRPTAAGARAIALSLANNDADENPFNISFTGTGVPVPEIAITRTDSTNLVDGSASIAFGSVNLGSATSGQTLTIRNLGSAFLTGIAVTAIGNHVGDFILTPPATTVLAPGATTTFGIAFRPGADGARTASLRIASNDADENPFDINLTGTGVAVPLIALEDASGTALAPGAAVLSFPDILVGDATAMETVVVKNTGTAALTGLQVSLSGTQGAHFILSAPTATTLAPGTSTTVQVSFSPQAGGGKTASLLIASSATPSAPLVLGLAGNATTAPEIAVSQGAAELTSGSGSAAFGTHDIASTSPTKVFTIRNLGSAPLTGIALRSGSGDFIVASPASTTLAPGTSTTFKVSFKPTAAGARSTTITLVSNDADESSFAISVGGSGVAVPEITVVAASGKDFVDNKAFINFSGVLVDGKSSQTVIIRNAGSAPLKNLSVSRFGSNSRDFTISPLRTKSLAPGASTSVRISFSPSKSGVRWGGLRILSNDASEKDFDIILTGTGKNKAVSKGGKKKKKSTLKTSPANALATATLTAPLKGVEVIDGKKYRTLTLAVNEGASPKLRDIEVSGNLTEWSSGQKHLTVLIDTATTFKVRDKIPVVSGHKRYIRLKR
ncbi:MAG: choice-of-anchor D domain-containing protein [Verrucomicrobiaceae bacterium]|nr:MAG: choice-of-anchor D domain-containing protein [Verrucomicrobiaceae bacterium]